jgi:hypothetical protein
MQRKLCMTVVQHLETIPALPSFGEFYANHERRLKQMLIAGGCANRGDASS